MHHFRTSGIAIGFAVLLVGFASTAGVAQLRRSGPTTGEAGPAAPPSVGIPRGSGSARTPFAGVWDGSLTLGNGPAANRGHPITMVFEAMDKAARSDSSPTSTASSARSYSGATILPNDARAPHLETAVSGGEMRWKQQNSGGGFWVYSARLVTRDSIAGTVVLRDWPQLPAGERTPAGTFALARRRDRR